MNKCYKCGQLNKGTWQQIGTDPEKDQRYEEFFCYDCGPQEEIDKINSELQINQEEVE